VFTETVNKIMGHPLLPWRPVAPPRRPSKAMPRAGLPRPPIPRNGNFQGNPPHSRCVTRGELRKFMRALPDGDDWAEKAESKMMDLFAAADAPVQQAIKHHDRILAAAMVSMVAGLVFVVLFAALNL
jgi:hypothetical protein